MNYVFDGVQKIIFLEDDGGEKKFNAQDLYSEWKRWVTSDFNNMKYPQAMRSIGGDPLSDTKYIAPYIEVMNDWVIKPFNGDYILTVTGNLFGTGGKIPFIGSDDGTVVVSMETTGNALALQTNNDNIEDYLAPTWNGAVGIIDAYQDGDGIHIRWGHAVDNISNEVKYNVYISDLESTIWDMKLGSYDGNMLVIFTEYDGITKLQPGKTYYIGVRAVDEAGNETDNTNYAVINYTGTSIYDEIITKLADIQFSLEKILNELLPAWDTDFQNKQITYYDKTGNKIGVFQCYDENNNPSLKSVRKMVRIE